MTIAVHISFSETGHPLKNFGFRCCTILAGKYPEHHFIFIFDKPFNNTLITQKNITPVLLSPQIRNRLLGYYWYNFKVPALLEKYNASVFIADKINVSLRTDVRQCMIIHDLSFMKKENLYQRSDARHLKKYFKKLAAKASCLAITNPQLVNELSNVIDQQKKKIIFSGNGFNENNTNAAYDSLQQLKEKYTEGKEFFVCYITNASISNSMLLLKAFSAFKKRQLSNMQLLFVMLSTQKENPVKDFANYKYRNEVKIIVPENDEILGQITSAAYAAIYLPLMEVMEDNSLLPIENNIPVLTTETEFCKGLYQEAALYTPAEEKSIAQNMMLLYKDENYRNELVNKGKALAAAHSWDKTADNLWQAIQQAAAQ